MHRSPRRVAMLAAPLTIAALALSACGSDESDPDTDTTEGAAAGETSTLVVYSGRDEELVAPLIEQFEEASGIDVDVRYAGTTELAAQILEEGDDTPADVFLSQDAGALGAVSEEGHFTTLPEEISGAVAEDYTSTDGSWVGLTGRARVVAYDSEEYEADDIPADVTEFTEPEWKGKFAVVPTNASFQAFVTALRVNDGEEAAQEWLEGIAANDPEIYEKNGEVLEAINSGEVGVGLINHYYWARAEGDPTEQRAQLKFGEKGSTSALVNVTGAGILQSSENTDAAEEFLSYLVSEDGQTYFVEETYEYPVVDGIPSPEGVPPLEELGQPDIDLSQLSTLEESVELITNAGLL